MFNAGRVGFTPKGDYDSTKTYSMLNVVSHQGSSYFAKGDVPVNTAPPNTTYWQLSAYGGSAANLAGNFAPLETTDYASQGYEIGDFLVNKNNQFCKATSIITLGDQIIVKPNAGYNVETTNAGKEVNRIDLRIDQLTASQIGYDGTTSGLSATDAQAAIDEVVSDLGTLENGLGTAAAKDSTNAVTQNSTDLVESGAVYTELATRDAEIATMNNYLGAKNLLPNDAATQTRDNVTYTVNPDKTINVETGSGGASQQTGIAVIEKFSSLSAGDYILSDGESNGVQLYINCFDNNGTYIKQIASCHNGAEVNFTVDYDGYTYMSIGFAIIAGAEVNTICRPMIRPATIKDATYVPYAKSNRELTEDTGYEEIDLSSALNGDWTITNGGFLKAFKTGRVVNIVGRNLTNPTGQQSLITSSNWPSAIVPPSDFLIGIAQDKTDNTTLMECNIGNKNMAIATPDFHGWYTAGKSYNVSITYIAP